MTSKTWLGAFLVFGMGCSVRGQRSVPPPPKPADSGPSLAATMQFIQEKLSEQGYVSYSAHFHDNADGEDWTDERSAQAMNFIVDPSTCSISYHWQTTVDGGVGDKDEDVSFSLRAVREIVVMAGEQYNERFSDSADFRSFNSRIDSPIFILVARQAGNQGNAFYFSEETIANRIAKAMVHAVELCGGGGNKDPF